MGLEICKERWMLKKIHNYLVTNSDECYEGKLQCYERAKQRDLFEIQGSESLSESLT